MFFQSAHYSPEIAALLAPHGGGQRPLPLVRASSSAPALSLPANRELFPGALAPKAALAGLHLYLDDWEGAHELAQAMESPEGRYWHAIVHRMEPDPGNAGYWFRALGAHPVFPALQREARAIADLHGLPLAPGPAWDPFDFIRVCGEAAARPGSVLERAAREVQLVEWQLLFDHCASAGRRSVKA